MISPLLANIYLDPLDKLLAERGYRVAAKRAFGTTCVTPMTPARVASHLAGACFVILCRSREEADAALADVRAWVAENGLTLHPEKTPGPEGHKGGGAALCARGAGVGDCRVPGQGFEFVTPKACFQHVTPKACFQHDGYRFEAGVRTVRKKSVDKLKDAIRSKTRRTRGESLEVIVTDLNRTLRGWFGYFRQAHSRIFVVLDKIIRRRLRALLRKREKRPGRGRSHDDQRRWPNAYFAEAGLFALHAAWQSARRPR